MEVYRIRFSMSVVVFGDCGSVVLFVWSEYGGKSWGGFTVLDSPLVVLYK